jgi:hypothetical protein
MIAAPQHEIKPPDAVIAEDVICQSFIQSSCTLAYACLLIRRGKHELAAHVLHSLEAKQASRFKDMVFYLQAQIGIETGEYAMVKRRLVPRVHQHPNDMVALSLLEACIHREYAQRADEFPPPAAAPAPGVPSPAFGNAEAASAAALAAAFAATQSPPEGTGAPSPASVPVAPPAPRVPEASSDAGPAAAYRTSSVPFVSRAADAPPAAAPSPAPAPAAVPAASAGPPAASTGPSGFVEIALSSFPDRPAGPAGREGSRGHRAGAPGDGELGAYQGLAQDPNTLALGVWGKARAKAFCRAPDLEPLMAMLPRELPAALQKACAALEGGNIHKICFSFQHLTASTFHAGGEGMALVTGPLNQSLLTIVRAENTFKKAALSGPAALGGPASPGSPPAANGAAATGGPAAPGAAA